MENQIHDIYIVGLGILSTLQVTRETEQTLRLCKSVYFLHSESETIQEYLNKLCPEVTDLHGFYSTNVGREHAYTKMVDVVVNAARKDPPVALALYGNPMVFVTPTQSILEIASKENLKVKVLPGLSSFDCMLVDLGVDPSQGTLIYEVNDMLLHRRKLLPDMHCFIWQVGGVESEIFTNAVNRPERFLRLKKYLLQFYPPDHEVQVITSAVNPIMSPKITRVSLSKLETEPIQMHAGSTMYIPPAHQPDWLDKEFLGLLTSKEHLKEITQ